MWFSEKLRRRLTETSNLVLDGFAHDRVGDRFKVDLTVVRQVVENVGGAHCFRSALFVTEDKVDPLMKLTRHNLRLQRLKYVNLIFNDTFSYKLCPFKLRPTHQTVDSHKLFRCFGPLWKLDVSHLLSLLCDAKTVAVGVDEHVWHEVPLGNQFLQEIRSLIQ